MIIDRKAWKQHQSKELHLQQKLSEFLKKAATDTEFYKEYLNACALNLFPVTSKVILIQNVTHLRSKMYPDSKVVTVHTSGSYGTPYNFYLFKNKKRRQRAEILFYGEKSGYQVGVKHAYFRSNPPKSKLKFFIQNECFFASKILDDSFAENVLQQLLKKK